ncbi:MAG: flippase, partial [Anaerolineae bacterium]
LKLALALAGAGAVLRWSQRNEMPGPLSRGWPLLAVALVALDLWLATGAFNPAVDPALLAVEPPSVRFLRAQASQELGRITTFEDASTSKTLNANLGWLLGLQDVRGYDSIIPRQYVQYMQAIEPQGGLLYNRISPFYDPASLTDPRTHLLGVRWVITELTLDLPGYTLIYPASPSAPPKVGGSGGGLPAEPVKIYRNESAFPRAFAAPSAEFVPADRLLDRLTEVDLHQTVLFDDPAALSAASAVTGVTTDSATVVNIARYRPNEIFIFVDLPAPAWLVLTDAYFSGWKAYTRPLAAEGVLPEQSLTLWRADGNFRAVHLDAGKQTVRFKYAPLSFQLGLYTSFLALMTIFLLLGWWAWGRFYRGEHEAHEVSRVAKNSLVPMGLALLNKGIDFAFALLRLRILSPAGEGSYTFAIGFYVIFEILVRFGLGTLLTREVARDRSQAGRYLLNVTVLRGWLWLASLPLLALVMLAYGAWGGLTPAEGWAIGLFALALLFAAISDGISAVFNAFEGMEYPSGVSTAIVLGKVALGALVLLPPLSWGFVGLAGVSVVMNLLQVFWLLALMRSKLPLAPLTRRDLDPTLQRSMLTGSLPLMLNHLLAHIFFRLDVWILKPLAGAAAVGLYGAAYKYIDGLNVIPSYFTLAIFPLLSRYAQAGQGNGGRAALLRSYVVALRLLVLVSLPIAILVTFIATPLIAILGGAAYLPGSAIALQLLIWSIPIGFTNSVTQYVLIAVDQQRFLTRAFIIGVVFNVAANLVFIPIFNLYAAAAITGLSELALCITFMFSVYRHVGPLPWGQIAGRPLLAGLGMTASLLGAQRLALPLLAQIALAGLVYVVILIVSGAFDDPDMQTVRRALPFAGRARR